ncbi:protein ACCELERATED CELL DEATH 6-like [Quercus lobata]|uniref:protein ACCELERATED CELL DEATH 6-like n=1 Tax=Quercus lobata TaxID=97700 RepID=UPI001245B257|nr:protein ACCELERATED CELL DEATH 6-like [Quercus lobata]
MPRKHSYSSPEVHHVPKQVLYIDAEMERKLPKDLEKVEESETVTEEEIAARPERKLETSKTSTDVSRRAANMHPDLYMAAKRGDTDFIKNLKAEDLERPVFQKTPQLNTVLHIAASLGHSQLVEAMLENSSGFWMDTNSAGELAVHVAASCGHLSTLKKLACVSGSVFLELQNNEGNTPLHLALMNKYSEVDLVLKTKYSEIAGFLVETNPEVSYCPNNEHKSPLYMAAEAGDAEMVKLMIEKADGINMAMVEGGGRILLPFDEVKLIAHAAITGKNIDVLDSVMSEGPHRIKDRDSKGMTPLSYAAHIGYLEGVRYFLNKFVDYMYESDRNGFFPIHTASSRGHIKIVQEFIQRCPDSVELLNHQDQNILHVAAMSGKAKVVNYMLKMPELEMLINEKDVDGNTSLHLTSNGGHPKVVSILTWDKRVDLKLLNDEGKTALDIAGEYSGKVPSFRERLTWLALRHAGVSHAPCPSMDKDKETITENSQSSKPRQTPNMDNYKDRVNTLLVVATLVATVTFAAGFTVPGGNDDSDPNKGMAKFLRHHLFQAFIISNTIAMYSSVTVVVALIWAQLGDLNLVIASLKFAVPILGLALIMVSSAFMTGSYLMVRGLHWLASIVLIIGSFFLLILTLLFFPLCLPSSLPHPIFRYIVYYPFCLLVIVTRSNTNDGEEK